MILALLCALALPPQTTTITASARGPHQPFVPVTFEPGYSDFVAGRVPLQPTCSSVTVSLSVDLLEAFTYSHTTPNAPALLQLFQEYGCYFHVGSYWFYSALWDSHDVWVPPNTGVNLSTASTIPTGFCETPSGVQHLDPGQSITITDPAFCAFFTGTGSLPIHCTIEGYGSSDGQPAHYATTYQGEHLTGSTWGEVFAGLRGTATFTRNP